MSRAHVQPLPVNHRELSYYFLFGTVLLFAASIVAASAWILLPSDSEWVSIGAVYQFPPAEQPYDKAVDGVPQGAWVVNIDGEISVFHRHSPYLYSGNVCPIAWNGANTRFEGPCWGSRFRLDGTLVDGPAKRDLDRYAFKIRDGELLVDSLSLILGTCREIPYEILATSIWDEPGAPPTCKDD